MHPHYDMYQCPNHLHACCWPLCETGWASTQSSTCYHCPWPQTQTPHTHAHCATHSVTHKRCPPAHWEVNQTYRGYLKQLSSSVHVCAGDWLRTTIIWICHETKRLSKYYRTVTVMECVAVWIMPKLKKSLCSSPYTQHAYVVWNTSQLSHVLYLLLYLLRVK